MSGGRLVALIVSFAFLALALAPAAPAQSPALQQVYLRCSGLAPDRSSLGLGVLENQIDRKLICWGHVGHHTYFVGNDTLYALHGGFGNFQPTETGVVGEEVGESLMPAIERGAVIETSVDGLGWSPVETVPIPAQIHPAQVPLTANFFTTTRVNFQLPDTGTPFRFLRIRQPMSADGALSGYMDGSEAWLNVTALAPTSEPALAARTNHYDCGQDILEDVFADHPCGFGQANHFDAVSTYHTYFLGARANITNISGTALLVPFRGAIGVEACASEEITGEVQASDTGRDDFRVVGTFTAFPGVPERFAFTNLTLAARFIRVAAAPCPAFNTQSGDHFLEGFLHSSTLDVTGDLPAHVSGTGPWSVYANDVASAAIPPSAG
ncbi:MAG: hypothetical protein ACYDCK_03235 [Thermoplasmatota archaeon]